MCMKKFSKFLENTFRVSNLRRVRLKVDPAYCVNGEISKFQGYEGFVLSEDGVTAKMYIENFEGGVMADIPCGMIDIESGLTKMEKLKMNILIFLKENKNMTFDSPLVQMVMNSPDIQTLESFLLNNGCTEKDLLEIYRMEYL
jgi:hypothetical protein